MSDLRFHRSSTTSYHPLVALADTEPFSGLAVGHALEQTEFADLSVEVGQRGDHFERPYRFEVEA